MTHDLAEVVEAYAEEFNDDVFMVDTAVFGAVVRVAQRTCAHAGADRAVPVIGLLQQYPHGGIEDLAEAVEIVLEKNPGPSQDYLARTTAFLYDRCGILDIRELARGAVQMFEADRDYVAPETTVAPLSRSMTATFMQEYARTQADVDEIFPTAVETLRHASEAGMNPDYALGILQTFAARHPSFGIDEVAENVDQLLVALGGVGKQRGGVPELPYVEKMIRESYGDHMTPDEHMELVLNALHYDLGELVDPKGPTVVERKVACIVEKNVFVDRPVEIEVPYETRVPVPTEPHKFLNDVGAACAGAAAVYAAQVAQVPQYWGLPMLVDPFFDVLPLMAGVVGGVRKRVLGSLAMLAVSYVPEVVAYTSDGVVDESAVVGKGAAFFAAAFAGYTLRLAKQAITRTNPESRTL